MKNTRQIFGAETVQQFQIMQYINTYFEEGALELELIDRYTIRGTDASGASLIFYYNQKTQAIDTREDDHQ